VHGIDDDPSVYNEEDPARKKWSSVTVDAQRKRKEGDV